MGGLTGLGSFAGGLVKGYSAGLDIKDKMAQRDIRDKKKKIEDDALEAGKNVAPIFDDESPIRVNDTADFGGMTANNTMGSEPMQTSDYGLGLLNYGDGKPQNTTSGLASVQRFADGGLVQEPPKPMAFESQSPIKDLQQTAGLDAINQTQAQPQAAQQARKPNFGKTLSAKYNAMRDKAMELGDMQLATEYEQAGFKIRDRMFNEGIGKANNQFKLTGDIKGYVDMYNHAIDDGSQVEGYEPTQNGYKMQINNGGNVIEQEFTADQIRDLVMDFHDPATRYAAEREFMEKRKQKTFETDEDIRKSKENEKNKVQTFGLDSIAMQNGQVIYDGSKNRQALKDALDVQRAAENPNDPNYELANKILARQKKEKIETAIASRAPRAEREPSFERLAYEDWSKEPVNKGKGKNQYLKEKSTWGKDEPLDSVTETSTVYEGDTEKKVSRTSKVPKQNQAAKPAVKPFNKEDLFKKYGVN